MKKLTSIALLIFIMATILTNSYLYSMVSVGHFKTAQHQQVLLFGESQDLDIDIQKPGYAARLIDSVLTILKNLTFKQRIAVLTEMEPNFFRTQNETSRLSPLATSLTTLYRAMLEKGRSPWVLTMEDRRGAESDYMNSMLGFIESKIQADFKNDLLMSYLTDPVHFKDKKTVALRSQKK